MCWGFGECDCQCVRAKIECPRIFRVRPEYEGAKQQSQWLYSPCREEWIGKTSWKSATGACSRSGCFRRVKRNSWHEVQETMPRLGLVEWTWCSTTVLLPCEILVMLGASPKRGLVFVVDCVAAKRRITSLSICFARRNQRALSHVFNELVELLEHHALDNEKLIVEDVVWQSCDQWRIVGSGIILIVGPAVLHSSWDLASGDVPFPHFLPVELPEHNTCVTSTELACWFVVSLCEAVIQISLLGAQEWSIDRMIWLTSSAKLLALLNLVHSHRFERSNHDPSTISKLMCDPDIDIC